MRLPTISAIPRATLCAASVALEQQPEGEQGAAAVRGSRIHAYVAARFRKWPLPEIGKTKVSHIQLGRLRRFLGHGRMLNEAAFSYDGATVELLGENIDRDYNRPGTLCGSADIIMARPHMLVVDIKTGSLPVPDPVDNWQIATLAMMAVESSAALVADVTGVIATLNRDGSWDFGKPHTWTLREIAGIRRKLDGFIATWREAHEQEASGWGVTPTPGAHCRFCKAVCSSNAFKKEESEAA